MLAPALHCTYGRAACHAQGDLTCEASSTPPRLSRIPHPHHHPDPDKGLADKDAPMPSTATAGTCTVVLPMAPMRSAAMAVRTTKNKGPKQMFQQQEKEHPEMCS